MIGDRLEVVPNAKSCTVKFTTVACKLARLHRLVGASALLVLLKLEESGQVVLIYEQKVKFFKQ